MTAVLYRDLMKFIYLAPAPESLQENESPWSFVWLCLTEDRRSPVGEGPMRRWDPSCSRRSAATTCCSTLPSQNFLHCQSCLMSQAIAAYVFMDTTLTCIQWITAFLGNKISNVRLSVIWDFVEIV